MYHLPCPHPHAITHTATATFALACPCHHHCCHHTMTSHVPPPGTYHLPHPHPHAITHTTTTTSALMCPCCHCRHHHTMTLAHTASLTCAASLAWSCMCHCPRAASGVCGGESFIILCSYNSYSNV